MVYHTTDAQAQFDQWSRSYDRSVLQAVLFGPSHDLILKHLRPSDRRLLDIGCGTGRLLSRVVAARRGMEAVGLDLSSPMLEVCAARCRFWSERTAVVRGDSQRLPFADDSFDAVSCSHSFHHYPDQAGVVSEMHRVLRPGGRLLVIDGYRDNPWGWLIFDVLVPWREGEVQHCSARRLRELFAAAGFSEVEQRLHCLPIPFMLTLGQAVKVPLRNAHAA